MAGWLVVVGTGIKLVAHVTREAEQWIRMADKVLHVVADPAVDEWIGQLNPSAECLNTLYGEGKPRRQTYDEMVERILEAVRAGHRVCAVFYGHPGVFVYPSHRAVRLAREEGFRAWMTPAVSAEDCLVSDLGLDPARYGCQSYEATGFLVRRRIVDPNAALILWQIGVIGDQSVREPGTFNREGIAALIEVLSESHGPEHPVTVYRAAQWPIGRPHIETVPVTRLLDADITPLSTLYVPPRGEPEMEQAMLSRLGLTDVPKRDDGKGGRIE